MQLCLTSGVSAAALSTLSAPRHRLPPASVAAFAAAPRRLRHSCSTCVKAQAVFEGPTGSGDEPLPEQPLAGSSPILEVERQTERALTYAGLTALLGVSGLVLAAAPATVVQFVWATRPSLFVAGVARITGALVLLAAVCANCLKVRAAVRSRAPSSQPASHCLLLAPPSKGCWLTTVLCYSCAGSSRITLLYPSWPCCLPDTC